MYLNMLSVRFSGPDSPISPENVNVYLNRCKIVMWSVGQLRRQRLTITSLLWKLILIKPALKKNKLYVPTSGIKILRMLTLVK